MIDYSDLSDADLAAKVIELRQKVENLAGGGGVERVSGEGRLMQFSRSNRGDLLALYQAAKGEQDKRNGICSGQRAIGVNFP